MKTTKDKIKLKIPALIKISGQLLFINNRKSYQIANASEPMLSFARKLSTGIGYSELEQVIHENKQINALYNWLNKKEFLVDDSDNYYVNTPNEKNYEYLISLNKNPTELLNKFRNTHIAIIGCGGTGSIVAQNLVAMGFHKLSLIDYDKIEYSNLNRQIIFGEDNVGHYKSEVLAKKLKLLNANVEITAHKIKIDNHDDLTTIYADDIPSFIVCGIDTPPIQAKIHILKFCEKKHIPCIFGGVGIEKGDFGPLIESSRYRSLFKIFLKNIKSEYRVEDINIIKGSLCPTNSIIASFIALDIFKWFSNLVPLSLNKISKIDFTSGQIKHELLFENC